MVLLSPTAKPVTGVPGYISTPRRVMPETGLAWLFQLVPLKCRIVALPPTAQISLFACETSPRSALVVPVSFIQRSTPPSSGSLAETSAVNENEVTVFGTFHCQLFGAEVAPGARGPSY